MLIQKQLLGFVMTLFLVLYFSCGLHAQWSINPTVNTPICTGSNGQTSPTIVSDGSGGAIITWEDSRSSTNDIYAQKVNSSGVVQWTTNGVAICAATDNQYSPTIVSDGSGGAIITWQDYRSGTNYDIYAQKINSSGAVQWTTNGVAICTATGTQYSPSIVSDGSGGAIILWNDYRSGTNYDIYTQKINSSGAVQWTADGVAICTATGDQSYLAVVSDGSGGAITTWQDYRGGATSDIYSQKINSSGVVQWTANGVVICTATGDQSYPIIVSDGSGGAIITWQDFRGGTRDIYAQKTNSSGVVQWTANGITICTEATSDQYSPTIVSDGSGGAIITWDDYRNGTSDVYAQKINSSGAVQWTADGEALCTEATSDQYSLAIVSDGSGGAIIAWRDLRSGPSTSDIYAQKINSSGAVQWTTNGAAICTATGTQYNLTIASDGSGGAIITWQDFRLGTNYHIYAAKVFSNGTLPVELTSFTAAARGSSITLNWVTATEVNNYGFEVERLANSNQPSAKNWTKIGFIEGSGTSNSPKEYYFTDRNADGGRNAYRLKQIDRNGKLEYSKVVEVEVTVPWQLTLSQNYPNPFNPSTVIRYSLSERSHVKLEIYDLPGHVVETLIDQEQEARFFETTWQAKAPSGIYFYRIIANSLENPAKSFVQVRKMLLLK